MSEYIQVKQDGRVLRITLNRPEGGNGVSDPMASELAGIIKGAAETSDMIVFRGAGADFCTGRWNPNPPPAGQAPPEAYEARKRSEPVFGCAAAFRFSPIPIVAAVQGRAMAFGCVLASVCDVTLAADNAIFKIPELGHNIWPGIVMSSLVDRTSLKGLTYMGYSQADISPQQAMTYGIVSKVVPAAALDAELDGLVAAMLKAPRPALLAIKEYVPAARKLPVHAAVDYAKSLHAAVNTSSEMKRGH